MQQKQELWKMSLSATSRSMGYTVFWQAAQLSFTWARRLKDCPGKRVSQGPDPCPSLLPPNTPLSGPYLGALDSAAATAAFGFLRERASQGQVRGMPQTIAAVTSPDPRSVGGWGKGWQTCRPSPPHPQARHLRKRSPPAPLITYMRGGGLGGFCSLEHGSVGVMEAPGGDAAPAGFCKGKSVGRAPQALP